MKKLRIYLDTSVISFLFADDAPDFRRVTEAFFSTYASRYMLYASGVVLAEIDRMSDATKRAAMREVWESKEALYKEVANLPPKKRIAAMLDRAHEACIRMRQNQPPLPRDTHVVRPNVAAEPAAEYRVKRTATKRKEACNIEC